MNDLFIYLVQSGIGLSLLFCVYRLFLRNDTYSEMNRYYLLSALILSLLFPFFKIQLNANTGGNYYQVLETFVVTSGQVSQSMESNLGLSHLLLYVYLAGSAIFLVRFLYRIVQALYLILARGINEMDGIKVVVIGNGYSPFSFFNVVFVNPETINSPHLKKILAHEKVHINQYHTIDLIIMEILTIVHWFNPFIWLYKNSLKILHEFLADEGVLSEGHNRNEYQELLINHTFGVQLNVISNNFNPVRKRWFSRSGQSQIKKRFIMMSKEKSKKTTMIKMLFIFPATFAITFLLSLSFTDNVMGQTEIEKSDEAEKAVNIEKVKVPGAQEDPVFTVVEVMPEYPGGKDALMKYLSSNIKYPENARKKKISGKVFVSYVVEKNGSISNVKILRSVHKELDAEAMRVIKEMPVWKPGTQRGKAVRVQYNLPIHFRLDSDGEKGKEPVYKKKSQSPMDVKNKQQKAVDAKKK